MAEKMDGWKGIKGTLQKCKGITNGEDVRIVRNIT